jgi:hypothetical protein
MRNEESTMNFDLEPLDSELQVRRWNCSICRDRGTNTNHEGTGAVTVEVCDCRHGHDLIALHGVDWPQSETARLRAEHVAVNDRFTANCKRITGRKPAPPRPVVAGSIAMRDVKRAVEQVRQ